MEVLEREREKFQETASVPPARGTEGSSWRLWNRDVWRRLGLRHPRRERGRLGLGLQELSGRAPITHFFQTSDSDF